MFDFDSLFTKDNLIFLVGAGCSIDSPSNLPSAKVMMEEIIKFLCPKPEIEKILNIKELRFEGLVGTLSRTLDHELKILDYYGLCDSPNHYHYTLVELLKNHSIVMTTNFDHLIELALLNSNISKNQIIPVISNNDYKQYFNPKKLFSQGKYPIYKLHGSLKNIITKQDTKDSIMSTLSAFGKNKSGFDLFELDPNKKKLFEQFSQDNNIVVIGYSGSDDFDIIPALYKLNKVKSIIWVDHDDNKTLFDSYLIDNVEILSTLPIKEALKQILKSFLEKNIAENFFVLRGNTNKILSQLVKVDYQLTHEVFNLQINEFLQQNLPNPNHLVKLYNAHRIYHELEFFNDSLRLALKIIKICEKRRLNKWEEWLLGLTYANAGNAYAEKGELIKGLEYLNRGLDIVLKSKEEIEISLFYLDQGTILSSLARYNEALKSYQKALQIAKKYRNKHRISTIYFNMATLFHEQGNTGRAKKYISQAIELNKKLGVLHQLASSLNLMGKILTSELKLDEALTCLAQASDIFDSLRLEPSKVEILGNMGAVYIYAQKFPLAIEKLEEALNIIEKYDLNGLKGFIYSNLGKVYLDTKEYDKAKDYYSKALNIAQKEGNLRSVGIRLNNLGDIARIENDFDEALSKFKKVLKIAKENEYLRLRGVALNNIGLIFKEKGKYNNAITCHQKAIEIAHNTKDPQFLIMRYYNLGNLYREIRRFEDALKCFKKAEEIQKLLIK